jgi:hypothetical protein
MRATQEIADRYVRPLLPTELVLSLDEKTSLQPRPRRTPTRPARPGCPVQVEHAYARAGAVHRFAAFDTRSGQVWGLTFRRKRQVEDLALLAHLDQTIPATITTIHLVADHLSVHHGKDVQRWRAHHPRFVPHVTPVHCAWMNQIEQWFSILGRKQLRHPNFADLSALTAAILQFIQEWNQVAHPFRWTAASFDKVLAKAAAALPPAASLPEAA